MMDIRAVCLALLVIVGTGLQPAVADDPQAVYGKTVDGWIAVVRAKTSTDDERRQAMRALSFFGEAANTAVPDLALADEPATFCGKTVEGWIAVLRDKSSSEDGRRQAMLALGYFGEAASAVVPDLTVFEREGRLKAEASEALIRIELRPERRVPRLIEKFIWIGANGFSTGPRDALVRVGGPAVPALIEVLNGPDLGMRVRAAEALGMIGPPAREAVPALILAVAQRTVIDEDELLCRHAVIALGRIGSDAKGARPILNHLFDKNLGDDYELVIALAGIGAPPVEKLVARLTRDGDSFATELLAWLGPKAREAIPLLKRALADERKQVRFSAAIALAGIEPPAELAVPVLIEALGHLDDGDLEVHDVPTALARLGPAAKAAMPALIALVIQGHARRNILETLVQVDPDGKECVPALVFALKHRDLEIVDTAARCLRLLGPKATLAVPALAAVLSRKFTKNGGVQWRDEPRVTAVKAIGRIAPGTPDAIAALIGALESDYPVAAVAAGTLGSFGRASKAAVPALIEAAGTNAEHDANAEVRSAAILALGEIGADARPAVGMLRTLCNPNDGNSPFATESFISLYRLAPDGGEVAMKWLAKGLKVRNGTLTGAFTLQSRAMVLAAMGRPSLEGDALTQMHLERMSSELAIPDSWNDGLDYLESQIEVFAELGIGARLAVPRLKEFRKHPDPWVRMWAGEALEKIQGSVPRRVAD
jgi:HEAT repeat protein